MSPLKPQESSNKDQRTIHLDGKGHPLGSNRLFRLLNNLPLKLQNFLKEKGGSEDYETVLIQKGALRYKVISKGTYREVIPINFHILLQPGERLDYIGELESDGLHIIQLITKEGQLDNALWNEQSKKLHRLNYQGEPIARISPPDQERMNIRDVYFNGGRNGTWSAVHGLQITSNPMRK